VPAVLTYNLLRPCGRSSASCIECTTSYTVTNQVALECRGTPPATICVKPGLARQTLACVSAGWEVELPPFLVAGFTLHD
jgi:hypothetical protein